jgi:hypothetical protein
MRHAIARRFPPVRLAILTVGALIAALVAAPAGLAAHGKTAPGNVTLTLTCTNDSCTGSWFWYQGGLTSPALSSGSIAGKADSTTTATTTQPAAADTLDFGVGSAAPNGCGRAFIEYFTPGSAINFTASVPSSKPGDYGRSTPCNGAGSSFNMMS